MYRGLSTEKILSYLKRNWFIFFAIAVYAFFTLYYMGPSVTSCNTVVYGFGDNTAGPIWQASLPEKQGPIGSYTNMTNAPYGENLENPIGYSLIAQTMYIRAMTTVAGPICGYNLANMTGFILSAMVMFGFILAITKKRWIALIAGYAVAFAPYFQLKIGAHFSFGFQAIFIGILWSFYNLVKNRRKRDAVLFSALSALAVYWDPYYSLLIALIIVPLALVWLALNKAIFTKKFWLDKSGKLEIKRQFKLLLSSAGIILLLLSPLVAVFLAQGSQISENVATSRGNILLETQYCSSWPHEYLVPFMYNPFFEKLVGKDLYHTSVSVLRDHYSCGIGEDVVGLSLVITTIMVLGIVAMTWDRLNRRKLGLGRLLHYEPKMLIYGLVAIIGACLALGFPPMVLHHIATPSYEMLQITTTWRTITRIFVILNIAVIALSSIFMVYFLKGIKPQKHKLLLAVALITMFVAILIEYQTARRPFTGNSYGSFDYTKSVPTQYNWLKQQKGIKTIAEYPLERSGGEGNSMAYYLSMQVAHGKKLFNGSLGYTSQEKKKTGLKNLYDPQTLPVLKAMGVDAIVVHGITLAEAKKIPYAKIIHSSSPNGFTVVGFSPLVKTDDSYVISLEDVPIIQDYTIAPQEGFYRSMSYVHSAVDWQYLSASKSTITIFALNGEKSNQVRNVCFDVRTVSLAVASELEVIADGVLVQTLTVDGNIRSIATRAKGEITLNSKTPEGLVISKLGCSL